MLKVLTCLTDQHDYRFVAVAAFVCLLASLTAFRLYSRARFVHGISGIVWFFLTGVTAGTGIWATHFIAMLAYQPGFATGYEPVGTLLSLGISVVVTMAAFLAARLDHRIAPAAGGILFGVGVGTMHYTGMAAFVTQGFVLWDHGMIALSVLLGMTGGIVAFSIAGSARAVRRQVCGGIALTLAICLLHFTGMGAMSILPDPSGAVPPRLLSDTAMTIAVATATIVILITGMGTALIDASAGERAVERLRRLASSSFEGVAIVIGDRIADANDAFLQLLGDARADVIGRPIHDILLIDGPAGLGSDACEATLQPTGDGVAIPVELLTRRFAEDRPEVIYAVRDLRERRAAEAKIRFLADHDTLTGLLNRDAGNSRIAAILEGAQAGEESVALLRVDLRRLKEVNDVFGEIGGDTALRETALRLRQLISKQSVVARLGSDEFLIAQVGSEQPAGASVLAQAVRDSLRVPIAIGDQTVAIDASIGISVFPDDGATIELLIANANMALRRARTDERSGFCFFSYGTDEAMRERRMLVRALNDAIDADELRLHYQPLANAEDRTICGFEALVRWQHPTRGLLPPSAFVALAEENGLAAKLGDWVLRRACRDAASWPKPLRVAVNLSPLEVHENDLPRRIHEVLIETGLSPSRLELEITETALFRDQDKALANLRRLKALGVRIAMDDFGTGFSSLSTLQSFPFDKLKIDKSFVDNLLVLDRATVIVRTILGLGQNLGIPIVAEGVETEAQEAFLRREGCNQLQGYFIGKPLPIDAFAVQHAISGAGDGNVEPPPADQADCAA